MASSPSPTAQAVNNHAFELSSAEVLERIPTEAVWVLIGEGSHGTKEFYETRAIITKDLIERRGFNAVAVEAGESFLVLSVQACSSLHGKVSRAEKHCSNNSLIPVSPWKMCMSKFCIIIAYSVPFLQTSRMPSGPTFGYAACQRTALQMKPLATSRFTSL